MGSFKKYNHIPAECEETSALNPCDFFDSLDFPMDIFAPPQKAEFFAGISSNIPAGSGNNSGGSSCGCSVSNVSNVAGTSKGCGCN